MNGLKLFFGVLMALAAIFVITASIYGAVTANPIVAVFLCFPGGVLAVWAEFTIRDGIKGE